MSSSEVETPGLYRNEPDALANSGNRVLLVEDDPAQSDAVSATLKSGGYETTVASSIEKGKNCFEQGLYGVAIVDLGLPDGSGIDLISHMRKADGNLVTVVLTGDHDASTVIHAMRAGAFDYLTKPAPVDTLLATMTRAMAHHHVLAERSELFRLLYGEREQLRSRVDAATADIRQYAQVCEQSNARLRSLLQMRQLAASEYSEEMLLRCVFAEMTQHVPLRGIVVGDPWRESAYILFLPTPNPGESGRALPLYSQCEPQRTRGPSTWTTHAEAALRECYESLSSPEDYRLPLLVFPSDMDQPRECIPGFVFQERFAPDPAAREFLDMCAYILRTEWERNRLLSYVAHQASLGNIALELSRNTIQPLTAIRTAADYLGEALASEEAAEGLEIIRQSVDRLRDQSQEFRNLAVHREDSVQTVHLEDYLDQALDMLDVALRNRGIRIERHIETHGECTLINGSALARTILDMILGGLRAAEPGGSIEIALRNPDPEHVAFEMWHGSPKERVFADSIDETLSPSLHPVEHPVGLRLAERTVYSCGGALTTDQSQPGRPLLRIQLPTNAARKARQEANP